jgi:hypothetical protein
MRKRIGAADFARLDLTECLQAGFKVGDHFLGPGPVSLEVLMARKDLAVGSDQIQSLILRWPLFLHSSKEVAGGIFLLANHIKV